MDARESGRREAGRIPREAWWGSLGLHAVLLGALFVLSFFSVPEVPARTYAVNLVAAADLEAPLAETPAPPQQEEEENRPPPPQPTEEPLPETELPSVEEEMPETEEPEREPARADEVGEETLDLQREGLRFVDPAYLENITDQINRYWRPPDTGRPLRAEIRFVIDRTGTVTDVEWLERSGSTTFDLEARGAIEAAARADVFGPLPEEYPYDKLPVSFYFDPSRR